MLSLELINILFDRANIIDDWLYPDLYAAYGRTFKPGSKTSVFYKKDLYSIVIKGKLNRIEPPKLLKERFMLETRGLTFLRNHFLFESFDRKLQQYIEGDLVNYNCRDFYENNNPAKFRKYEEDFAVLTLGELEAGFVVCLVPLALTVLVFMIEWIPTLKNFLVFLFIYKKYFELKKFEQSQHSELMKIKIALWQKLVRYDNQQL